MQSKKTEIMVLEAKCLLRKPLDQRLVVFTFCKAKCIDINFFLDILAGAGFEPATSRL